VKFVHIYLSVHTDDALKPVKKKSSTSRSPIPSKSDGIQKLLWSLVAILYVLGYFLIPLSTKNLSIGHSAKLAHWNFQTVSFRMSNTRYLIGSIAQPTCPRISYLFTYIFRFIRNNLVSIYQSIAYKRYLQFKYEAVRSTYWIMSHNGISNGTCSIRQ
jgi:hypothetical protein